MRRKTYDASLGRLHIRAKVTLPVPSKLEVKEQSPSDDDPTGHHIVSRLRLDGLMRRRNLRHKVTIERS